MSTCTCTRSQEHEPCLIKNNNSKCPSKYSSRKSLQVSSCMLPLFCHMFKIHNTHQQEIKNLLLKTNNKRNSTIGNLVKKSYRYCNRVLDRCNTNFFKLYRSWIAKSSL